MSEELDADERGLATQLGENLRRLRRRHGLSVERLAIRSGVSRSTISDVERARKVPSINVVNRLARALAIDFGVLVEGRRSAVAIVRRAERRAWKTADARVAVAALFPWERPPRARLYQLHLAARARYATGAHGAGTTCYLVVGAGAVAVELGDERHEMGARDALIFDGDAVQTYVNQGDQPAELYVMLSGGRATPDGAVDWREP